MSDDQLPLFESEVLPPAIDLRKAKGQEIADAKKPRPSGTLWLVPSQSNPGTYVVDPSAQSCTCPDHSTRATKCKHMWAVEYVQERVAHPDGSETTTETVRVTYARNWPAYHRAQCAEKATFEILLRDLCSQIAQEPQHGRGRPSLPISDVLYGAATKVYSTVSGRRASTDIRECATKGLIDRAPHYNSIFNYLDKPELTPILTTMIEMAAVPLRAVEQDFAIDATGFSTSVYRRWYDHKYGREMKEHTWLKCHAMVGVRTNVVTAARVTAGDTHDSPEMEGLVRSTARSFDIHDVTADRAYLSHRNMAVVEHFGGEMLVPFKINSQGEGSEAWARLWHLFALNRPAFMERYMKRNNAESAFSAIKRKFGGSVRGRKHDAQVNEILCKLLCHNLVTLVHAMHDQGLAPRFGKVA